jgi:hypothetical protein
MSSSRSITPPATTDSRIIAFDAIKKGYKSKIRR